MLFWGRRWGQREHGRRSWSGLRSRPCGECWHERLRCRSPVADRGMRPHRVVVTTPAFNDDLSLPQRVEDLAIEQLVAQPGIKTLDEPVLPRTARRDVGGLCSDGADPLLHRLGNELRAIIGTDMPGNAAQDEQVGEPFSDVAGLECRRNLAGQAGSNCALGFGDPSWPGT